MTFVMSVFRKKCARGITLDMIKGKKKKNGGGGVNFLIVTVIFGYCSWEFFYIMTSSECIVPYRVEAIGMCTTYTQGKKRILNF